MAGRNRGARGGKSEPCRKRTAIDLQLKLRMIKKYEGGRRLSAIARELGLAVSTVSSIIKDATRIKDHVKGSTSCLKSTIITKRREGALIETERLLTIWMDDQVKKHAPLNFSMIQAKAKSFFEGLKGRYPAGIQSFGASKGWFSRFKKRARFQSVQVSGECSGGKPAESAAKGLPGWLQNVMKKAVDEGHYLPEQIFNIDETGLYYQKMPSRTYIAKEERTMSGHTASKSRLKLLLGANVCGTYKLKPLLVHHSENPRALRGISKATLPVHYRSNEQKASVTSAIFEDWYINCFIPEVEKYCKDNDIPFKILLILDGAPSHSAPLDDFHPNVKVLHLPASLAFAQPMGQGVFDNFSAHYLKTLFAHAIETLDANPQLTLRDFWKSYNIYHAIKNIAKAWEEITQTCLNSVWKRLCPQFVHDSQDLENDNILKEVGEKIIKLASQLQLEVNEDDIKDLVDSHANKLSKAELVELQAAKLAEEQNETLEPDFEPKGFTAEKMAVAFRELSSCLGRFEKMDPNTSRFLKVQRMAEDTFASYREIYEEKKKADVHTFLDKFAIKLEPHSPIHDSDFEPSTSQNITMPTSSWDHPVSHDIDGSLQTITSSTSYTN